MKKLQLLLCLLLAVTLSGCVFFPENSYQKLDPPEVVDAVKLQYTTAKAERQTISDTKEFTGKFVYSYYQSFPINSFAQKGITTTLTVPVKEGQTVKQGDVLLQFDTTTMDESIAHQQVNVAQCQQGLNEVQDKTSDAYTVAKSLLDEAQAVLKGLEETKAEYTVTATFAGKIHLNYESTANEAAGQVKEVVLFRDDELTLTLDAEQSNQTLKLGETGTIYQTKDSTKTGVSSQGSVRKVPVMLATGYSDDDKLYYVDAKDKVFAYDDAALFVVTQGTHENVICIPARALKQYKSDEYYVRVLASDGITRTEVTVKVGIVNAQYAEITSGINEGDTVILE